MPLHEIPSLRMSSGNLNSTATG